MSAWSARIVTAFIDVGTADARIAGVARLTHAFRRICWCAFAVDAARETLAWALTLVAVLRIGEVWRRTDALARLHALLVSRTLFVVDATHLRRRADALVGVAGVVVRTQTFEFARTVDTICSESASLNCFDAFVDILTGAVCKRTVSGGASAIADAAGDIDALGARGAVAFASGAVAEQAAATDDAVWRLTSTFDTVADVATLERIAFQTRGTGAFVTAWQVFADGAETASWLVNGRFQTLVDVAAETGDLVADESTCANTHAPRCYAVTDAFFSCRATVGAAAARGRGSYLLASFLVRFAFVSARALATEASWIVATDGTTCARFRDALVDVNAAAVHCRSESRRTHTFGNVVDQHALLIGAAAYIFARVYVVKQI